MQKTICIVLLVCLSVSVPAQVDEKTRRLDMIRYGIESQLLELLNVLITEKNDMFNEDLVLLLDSAKNPKLKSALFDFFARRNYEAVQGHALAIIKNRDNENEALALAAFNYLISAKSTIAHEEIKDIIVNKESKFLIPSIKLLSFSGLAEDAELIIKLYADDGTIASVKQEAILALGTLKYKSGTDFFKSILESETSTKTEKIYSCVALGKIEDDSAIPILVNASVLEDPNVRAAAIQSLENYSGIVIEQVILESLKDSHIAPRLAGVSAAAKLKLQNSIPYLQYKAKSDPEKSVRDLALFALGEIGGEGAEKFLSDYVLDIKIYLQHRLKAFRVLVEKGFPASDTACMKVFTESAGLKDKTVFLSFAKVCTSSESLNFIPYIKILLTDKDFNYRLGALVWIEKNKVKELTDIVKNISENDPVESIRKKASLILEKLSG